MKKIISMMALGMLVIASVFGQVKNERGEFIVEFDAFTPPEQDLLREMIGKKAMNFLANDLNGVSHSLTKYEGSNVLLAFWSADHPHSTTLFQYLEMLSKNQSLQILTYCYEPREMAEDFMVRNPSDVVVMPQGKFISEVGFGHDLGVPRIFFIDQNGVILDILPSSAFEKNQNLYPVISDIVDKAF